MQVRSLVFGLGVSVLAVLLSAGCTPERADQAPTTSRGAAKVPSMPPPPITEAERKALGPTRLYATGGQSFNVQVIDPKSGHSIREIPARSNAVGLAVSPSGDRLYIADDRGTRNGRLRAIDTSTWAVEEEQTIPAMAHLLGGSPISLSGDGRWIIVSHYSRENGPVEENALLSVYDTGKLDLHYPSDRLRDKTVLPELSKCTTNRWPPQLFGRPGHERLYLACDRYEAALDARTLVTVWRKDVATSGGPALALSPSGDRLYSLRPLVEETDKPRGTHRILGTDLQLSIREAATGRLLLQKKLSGQVKVPPATTGSTDAGYLAISHEGTLVYVAWEDRIWTADSADLSIVDEARLPAPGEAIALSPTGDELYVAPANSGDIKRPGHGLWALGLGAGGSLRHMGSDWPDGFGVTAMSAAPLPDSDAPVYAAAVRRIAGEDSSFDRPFPVIYLRSTTDNEVADDFMDVPAARSRPLPAAIPSLLKDIPVELVSSLDEVTKRGDRPPTVENGGAYVSVSTVFAGPNGTRRIFAHLYRSGRGAVWITYEVRMRAGRVTLTPVGPRAVS